MIEDDSGTFFGPDVDLIEPAVEDIGGAGEGEVGVDVVGVVRGGNCGVLDGKAAGEGGEHAGFDDLPGNDTGAALGLPLIIDVFGGKGRENDQDEVEEGAKLTDRHGGNDLPEG